MENIATVHSNRINALMGFGLTDRQALIVDEVSRQHKDEYVRERMHNIREGIFMHYTYSMSMDIWDKCKAYIKKNP